MNKLPLTTLLDQLAAESLINKATIPDMLKSAQQETTDKRPWYLQLLIAFTAYVAAAFIALSLGSLISLIISQFNIKEDVVIIMAAVFGAILCAVAILSQHKIAENRLFVRQIMLTMMVIGAGLLAFFTAFATESLWGELWGRYDDRNMTIPFLITLTVAAVTFFLYNSRVYRFFAFATVLVCLSGIIYLWEFEDGIHIMIALCAAGSIYLWQKRPEWQATPRIEMLDPLSYALPMALCSFTTFAVLDMNTSGIDYWWLSTLSLGCILIFFTANLLRDYNIPLTSPAAILALVGCVILTLPALVMPGITAGFLILLLAFWRNNPILMALATLYFLYGIGYYYYDLNLTLLVKSIVLMATGGVLLAGSFITRRLTA